MIFVGELRLEPDRAGVRIDLVIDRQQRPRGEFFALLAVIGIHCQAVSGSELGEHLGQVVLGDGKDDRDGFSCVITASPVVSVA